MPEGLEPVEAQASHGQSSRATEIESDSADEAPLTTQSGSFNPRANWVPDGDVENCMCCHAKFSYPLKRKHHCRKCGEVVCSSCSKNRQVVLAFHPTRPQRVCRRCETACETASLNDNSAQPRANQVLVKQASSRRGPEKIAKLTQPVPSGLCHEFGVLSVRIIEAKGLVASDRNLIGQKTTSDPYCVIGLEGGATFRTKSIRATLEPAWDEKINFLLGRANPVLSLTIFDKDLLDKDDPIGYAKLPLGGLHASKKIHGWAPLLLDSENHAGAVLLEMELHDFKPRKHLMTYVRPEPPIFEPPRFDIGSVYSPSMHLVDLVWTRLTSRVLFAVLDLILWTSPWRSLLVVVLWNVLAAEFLAHWPAIFFAGLALYVLSCGVMKLHIGSGGDETDDAEASGEEEIGSFVGHLAGLAPHSVKDLCRGLQPVLRLAADICQLVHDLFTWEHPGSPAVVLGLLVIALLCEVLPFSTLVMFVGSAVLLACSPPLAAAFGLLSYVQWYFGRFDELKSWDMRDAYLPEWSSADYVRKDSWKRGLKKAFVAKALMKGRWRGAGALPAAAAREPLLGR